MGRQPRSRSDWGTIMPLTYDFSGRVAIVTGGSNGIGAATAKRLAAAGAKVANWDLVLPPGSGPLDRVVDVSKPETVATATAALKQAAGRIDIVVHCAGYVGPTRSVVDYDPAEWRRLIDVNLIGTYEVFRHVVPVMRERDYGRLVSIASIAGKEGTPNSSAYSAAKAGVIALTKSLGKELATTGIRVNTIAPTVIETGLLAQMTKEHLAIAVSKTPMQRVGTVDEVAEIALWLASDACTFNTGAVFDLSGGRATY
jgi:3-oxoacyl-[acyl-carrier protein] reductase